jgi:aspartate/methionine/tyrosine aminotransferase
MARLDGITDSREAAKTLIDQQQVVTIPGRFFGIAGEGYLRVSYGAVTRERLQEASGRIASFLRVVQTRR